MLSLGNRLTEGQGSMTSIDHHHLRQFDLNRTVPQRPSYRSRQTHELLGRVKPLRLAEAAGRRRSRRQPRVSRPASAAAALSPAGTGSRPPRILWAEERRPSPVPPATPPRTRCSRELRSGWWSSC